MTTSSRSGQTQVPTIDDMSNRYAESESSYRPTINDQLGGQDLENVTSLIERFADDRDNAAIGARSRWSDFHYLAFDVKNVARASWIWPVDLASSADDAICERQTRLDVQSHSDCGGVPATCRKAAEQRLFRRLPIKMERLGVKGPRESLDLLLVERMRSADEGLPALEIVQIQLRHITPFPCVRCCRSKAAMFGAFELPEKGLRRGCLSSGSRGPASIS
jgi:hypothetical protein